MLARIYLALRVLDDLVFLYTKGAITRDGFDRMQRKMGSVIKKQTKTLYRYREFLLRELAGLHRITVNNSSQELMKVAAPDTYATLKSYMERRLHDVNELQELAKMSKDKEEHKEKKKKKK